MSWPLECQAPGDTEDSSKEPHAAILQGTRSSFSSPKSEAFFLLCSVPMHLGQRVNAHRTLSSPRALSLPAPQGWFYGQYTYSYHMKSQSKDTQGKDNVTNSTKDGVISTAGVGS